MSREIKFRAWDGIKMHRVGAIHWPFRSDDPTLVKAEGRPYDTRGEWPKIENPILMQYTGLKDKNGVEVYQGDYLIVAADEDGYGSTSYGGIVEVTAETCGFSLKPVKPTLQEREQNGQPWDSSSLWHINDPRNIEVIGNIYENPELVASGPKPLDKLIDEERRGTA